MANKREVDRLAKRWRDRLWLGHWLVTTALVEEIDPDDTAYSTTATVDIEAPYKKVLLTINEKAWDELTPKKRNRTICHEMVHSAMSPMTDFVERMMLDLPPSKRSVYRKWHEAVDEAQTEHFCNVLLEANGELN